MPAPQVVQELVDRFARNREAYQSSRYNETQLRREFLDPFFKALGWDVDNEAGHAEAYKDVIHEDAIKIGGATKAPDYCFRIGGRRIFFLEAKKPAVNVKTDDNPAYQLRRYAWSAKLPLSILSDFEELAVYDCRAKPDKNDKAAVSRVMFVTFDQYVGKWDELAGIFSKDAVQKGSFDKFAESNRRKKGTAEVDAAFLAEIESWRDALARNFALRNEELDQRDLNFAVQRTIDRIIFLRMCEDRGVEPYAQLMGLLNGEQTYARLRKLFRDADDRYNSGLFHFHKEKDRAEPPDELTPSLTLDDKPLKELIRGLYYPESPYEFSVLPAEILGNVYEQFLGKVIRLTAGHKAVVEDKPEVKKAGGVFYTPAYVVDYIVEQTVGKLMEGKTPKQVSKLRVLDPACGSGSFLVGAYQFLINWHRDWYVADGPRQHAKEIYQGQGGQWFLSTAEKKRILLNNIYGVDIDSQAVEVTKLSLLLKVLENENRETLDRQLRLLHERALPDLGENIKCGNSLIGPDFYQGQQLKLLDEEEQFRINAFDWGREFPEVFKSKDGGFDAVIGNPPYIRMEAFKDLKSYLREHYVCHDERSDLYVYFIEQEHNLLRRGGKFGMIVSNKFVRANYGRKVRELLTTEANVERLVDLAGLPVFRGATVRTVVLLTTKAADKTDLTYSPPLARAMFAAVETGAVTLAEAAERAAYRVQAKQLQPGGWHLNGVRESKLLAKLSDLGRPLAQYVSGGVCRGIVSGLNEAFIVDEKTRNSIVRRNAKAAKLLRPFLQGRDIRAYSIEPRNEYLIYTHHDIDMTPLPAVLEHLQPFRKDLQQRATKQAWYELQQPQFAYLERLERPKIVFPDIATTCRFALDTSGKFGSNTVYFLPTDDLCLLGLLNSRLAHFYFSQTCAALEGSGEPYLRFFGQYLENFPVYLGKDSDKKSSVTLRSLVEKRIAATEQLSAVRTPDAKIKMERQIHMLDGQIDRVVYEIYGLTEDEIALVGASAAGTNAVMTNQDLE